MLTSKETSEAVEWYKNVYSTYDNLSVKMGQILKEALLAEKLPYHKIETRAKGIESFKNKLENGFHANPKEMQDLAGIRIITYVNSDVEAIVELIKKIFDTSGNPIDKSESLGTDKVGYKSIHIIAKIPPERLNLVEYRSYKDLIFEIQVRTILQHAWAEIEHNRSYKFKGILPKEIKRQLTLLSGLLEIADNEFNSISQSIEKYSFDVLQKAKEGKLEDVPINTPSLKQYLIEKFRDLPNIKLVFGPKDDRSEEIIGELRNFGLQTLGELEKLIPTNYKDKLNLLDNEQTNLLGLLRDIMMINNYKKYFSNSWKKHWNSIEIGKKDILFSYINKDDFIKHIKELGIEIRTLEIDTTY